MGLLLIGARRPLIVTMMWTLPSRHSRVNDSIKYTQIIVTKEARQNNNIINNNVLNIHFNDDDNSISIHNCLLFNYA